MQGAGAWWAEPGAGLSSIEGDVGGGPARLCAGELGFAACAQGMG